MREPVMTYEQMLAVFDRGHIDLKKFDKGRKSHRELYDEIRTGAATIRYNEEGGRIERFAKSVRIAAEAEGCELRETARWYERTNSTLLHPQPLSWAASETYEPLEDMAETVTGNRWSPLSTGTRCLRQEWGLASPKDFEVRPFIGTPEDHRGDDHMFKGTLWYDYPKYDHPENQLRRGYTEHPAFLEPTTHPVEVHESKAYREITSIVEVAYLRLIMPRIFWDKGRKLKDGNVYLLLKWFPVFEVAGLRA